MKIFQKIFFFLTSFFFLLPTPASAHIVDGSAIHTHGIDVPLMEHPAFPFLILLISLVIFFLIRYLLRKTA